MILHIILDLNLEEWKISEGEDPQINLEVFINAFLACSQENSLKIINGLQCIYDSENGHLDFSNFKSGNINSIVKDLGLSIAMKPDRILILNMTKEKSDEYIFYLKSMFTAQKYGIRIDGFCSCDNPSIKMICHNTGGVFYPGCSISKMISTLGNIKPFPETSKIHCTCCNKETLLGLVCPICLTVYCKFTPICKRCKTKFSFQKS